jgi:hypothetical protein
MMPGVPLLLGFEAEDMHSAGAPARMDAQPSPITDRAGEGGVAQGPRALIEGA